MSHTYKEMERELNKDGSKNSFYSLHGVEDYDDFAELLKLNGFEFNIGKTLFVNIGDRHDGTNRQREAKKCLHYAIRRAKMELGKDEVDSMIRKYLL